MTPLLSVVIPFRDECGNIAPLVHRIHRTLEGLAIEVILVDDGSVDGSADEAESVSGAGVTVLSLQGNHGQSAAIKAGMDLARGRYIATLDADGQNPPEDLLPMIHFLESGEGQRTDLVQGYRDKRNDPLSKRLPSRWANLLIRLMFRVDVKDAGCSMRVFRSRVREHLLYFNGFHRYLPLIAMLKGLRVRQVAVGHAPRESGVSKYGLGRVPVVLWQLLLLRFRPGRLNNGLPYRTLPTGH